MSQSHLTEDIEPSPGARRLQKVPRSVQPGQPPSPPNPLIGRDDDVAAASGMLVTGGVRLLTLTGPGGVGKTRLALRIADEAATAFDDGVIFVSLAAITDPELVLPTVARTLGLRQGDGLTPAERIVDALRERRLLLVLDNFEQVRPAARQIAALLAACPGVSALVTSRARLRLSDEQRYPVAPLALPAASSPTGRGEHSPWAVIAASPAVQLFLARAKAVEPRFDLSAENATTIAAICRQLEGLPLAIELAAARTVLLSPVDLLDRLDPALPLLTGGPDDAPDRLQTMRAAIAWSYDQLTPEEQRLVQSLAVFRGGFTLEAVEGAIGPPLLDLLTSLVETSLLQRGEPVTAGRFGMLETIREFVLERLEASGEAEAARRAHALYFVRLTEDARVRVHGPEGSAVLDRLETEHDNLRAALSWTISAKETDLALRLAYAAWRFWWMRSHLDQGRTWLDRALTLPDAGPGTAALRSRAQVAAGYFARVQGDYARAAALGAAALAIAQELDDAHGSSGALHLLSLTATDRGEWAAAQAHLEAGIAIDRSVNYDHGVAFGLSDLGDVALARGLLADAAAFAGEALAIWEARGDAWSVAWAQIGCGKIARAQGDQTRAVSLVCDALAGCIKLGDKEIAARGISELAAVAAERGELRLAARLCGSVAALRQAIGAPLAPSERARHDALVQSIRDGLPKNTFAAAWEAGHAFSLATAVAESASLAREASASGRRGASTLDFLTRREREVLHFLARGWSDKQIAEELFISSRTASKHVAAITAKLGVASRGAAVAIAVRDLLV